MDWIGSFMEYLLLEKGFSKTGLQTYHYAMQGLSRHCLAEHRDITCLTTEELLSYLAGKEDDASSLSKKISIFRHFYKYLSLEGHRLDNPLKSVPLPKLKEYWPDTYTIEQVNHLLQVIQGPHWLAQRDKTIVELIYSCGLRVSEALNLTYSDVHLQESVLLIHGKGSKQRWVPMGKAAQAQMEKYIQIVQAYRVNTQYLFLNYQGQPLDRKGFWKRYKQWVEKAGLQTSKIHTLRHCFAVHLLEGGADISVVQHLLGHSQINTTQIYTKLHRSEILSQEYHYYHPRGNKAWLSEKNTSTGSKN